MRARLLSLVLLLGIGAVHPRTVAAQRIKLPYKVPELETRMRADSNDPAAHYNLALGYWNDKRYDDAEKSIRTALMLDPRFAPAHLALYALPFARQPKIYDAIYDGKLTPDQVAMLKESDREYRHAFLIDPLVDIRIIGAITPPKPDAFLVQEFYGEWLRLFFEGFTDCQEGRYEDCHGRFVSFIREIQGDKFPDRIPNVVLWYKGLAASHIQQYDIAARHFNQLIDRNIQFAEELEKKRQLSRVPLSNKEYRYTLATIKASSGANGEAVRLYQQVLEEDPGLYMAHVRLASIYEGARDYTNAEKERRFAVNTNPDDPSLLLDLGITLGKAGKMAEAETQLLDAIKANPRDSRAYFWLGIAQTDLGKQAAAKDAYTQFLALAPSRYGPQIASARDRLAKLP